MERESKNEDARTRSVTVVTGGRSDYGLLYPLLRRIEAEPTLKLHLWATGAHFAREFGHTVDEILADGFSIAERIDMLMASDTPEAVSKSIGIGVLGFAQAYARCRPDILVGLGDRCELFAAVQAALPFNVPVAHISGGEVTEGVIDESIRHALTKLSHLHFVATEVYARRVIQMGEEPWRVHISGETGLDNIATMDFMAKEELERRIGMPLCPNLLLVTFHPVRRDPARGVCQVESLLAALDEISFPTLFTYPNADAGCAPIIEAIERYVATHPTSRSARNLGRRAYCSLMRYASAVVGNSSSGIVEAASFELAAVNIGDRQRGRLSAENVVDCDDEKRSIVEAILKATSPKFGESLRGMKNPYGDGHACERIVSVLKDIPLGRKLIVKRFHDIC